MRQELFLAGFGGQGIMLMGRVLAYAAMLEGKHVVFLPAYGSEMRGGTANCTVIVSDTEIELPFSEQPNLLLAMNGPSLSKFEKNVRTGGIILTNSSMVEHHASRNDVIKKVIAANNCAIELGQEKVANMVALGSILRLTECVELKSVHEALCKSMARHPETLSVNFAALDTGYVKLEDYSGGEKP